MCFGCVPKSSTKLQFKLRMKISDFGTIRKIGYLLQSLATPL